MLRHMTRKQTGFTLIELMIVVAIIAILASMGLPAYRKYVVESNRAIAKANLLDMANRMEQYFVNNKTYTGNFADLGLADPYYVDANGPTTAAGGVYGITLSNVTNLSYDIVATPQGTQTQDSDCGTYTLSQNGSKTVSGPGGLSQCW